MPERKPVTQIAHRRLNALACGEARLLSAVRHEAGATMIFAGATPDTIGLEDGHSVSRAYAIGQGAALHLDPMSAETAAFQIGGQAAAVALETAEPELFSGRHAIVALRNGESVETVIDWLRFHATQTGMQAALIFDRAAPDRERGFFAKLSRALDPGIEGLEQVVVVDGPVPLGKPGHGPETDPYYAPGAPGKARMTEPQADPWHAPLGDVQIYEALRWRFLSQAAAIANLDLSDLVTGDEGPSIFARAEAAPTGLLRLQGQPCYPWRVRKGQAALFSDHICVQFDAAKRRQRWCIAPARLPEAAIWKLTRIVNADPGPAPEGRFFRHMLLRHPTDKVSQVVPKAALVEEPELLAQAKNFWAADPVRAPQETPAPKAKPKTDARVIVTCMKDEGPFILEWLAHHRAIGFDTVLVYSNDCSDGTDTLLDVLQEKGLVEHRDNPYRSKPGTKPQHAAFQAAEHEPCLREARWIACIDVDEFINIKIGRGHLDDLFAAVPKANMIAMTWRLFGNADAHDFTEDFVTERFTLAAPELCRKPHQAWGFKTLFENLGHFKKLGVHRPKGLKPQLWEEIRWVNGSGRPMPREMLRNAWRSTMGTYGYDLVQLNHYAVRSAESFLVKRARGRVNHTNRDQGLAYWFRMNNNAAPETSISRLSPMVRAEWTRLMDDPEIAAAHRACVAAHREKIETLMEAPENRAFYEALTSPRMEKLSRMHHAFGANVFLAGPEVIPDTLLKQDLPEGAYFTVERQSAKH
ncbi:MAG: glycosyltransferase family 2 protein [Pseudomonadota bacterium]